MDSGITDYVVGMLAELAKMAHANGDHALGHDIDELLGERSRRSTGRRSFTPSRFPPS